jgi:hypothetical protein
MQLTPPQVRALESLSDLHNQVTMLKRQLWEVEQTYKEERAKVRIMLPGLADAIQDNDDD